MQIEQPDFGAHFNMSTVSGALNPKPTIRVFVRGCIGASFTIEIDPKAKPSDLMELIQEQSGMPISLQRLIFGTKQMCDEHTLQEVLQI